MAIGVDEMSWDDLDNKHYDWPEANMVYEYRDKVKKMILDIIDKTPVKVPVTWESIYWIIMMGIEH